MFIFHHLILFLKLFLGWTFLRITSDWIWTLYRYIRSRYSLSFMLLFSKICWSVRLSDRFILLLISFVNSFLIILGIMTRPTFINIMFLIFLILFFTFILIHYNRFRLTYFLISSFSFIFRFIHQLRHWVLFFNSTCLWYLWIWMLFFRN